MILDDCALSTTILRALSVENREALPPIDLKETSTPSALPKKDGQS